MRLSNLSKRVLAEKLFGIRPVRYAEGSITLYLPDPDRPDLYAFSTRWDDNKNLRVVECTIPKRMMKDTGKSVSQYMIGKDTYLLPEIIFNKLTGTWKFIRM